MLFCCLSYPRGCVLLLIPHSGSQHHVDKALSLIGKKFKELNLTNIYAPPLPSLALPSLPMTSWVSMPLGAGAASAPFPQPTPKRRLPRPWARKAGSTLTPVPSHLCPPPVSSASGLCSLDRVEGWSAGRKPQASRSLLLGRTTLPWLWAPWAPFVFSGHLPREDYSLSRLGVCRLARDSLKLVLCPGSPLRPGWDPSFWARTGSYCVVVPSS